MKIYIGENELEVISAGARQIPSGGIKVIVEAKQDIISHDDLRALFKDTTEDLIIVRDDGRKETYGGCHYSVKVADDEKDGIEIHRAEIKCSSEAEFQLGRLRGMVAELTVKNETLEQKNLSQQAVIENLNQQLLMVQMAAADLYEKNLAAVPVEETEEPAEEIANQTETEQGV